VPAVEREDRADASLVSEYHDRRIDNSDVEIAVALDHCGTLPEAVDRHRTEVVRAARQFAEHCKFGFDTEACGDEVVEFGHHVRRHDQRVVECFHHCDDCSVGRFASIEQREQCARVGDDHRSPKPASSSSTR
jgi:hypothetical protein